MRNWDDRNHWMTRKRIAVAVAAAMGITSSDVVLAADEEDSTQLEEITVTARKREESLQDTPLAVSAFTAASLERQQIASTEDLDQVTPNLQFAAYGPLSGNNAAAQVFIRGIGQTDSSSGVDPGVGLYMDDVYMGRSVGGVMDFRDVSGIQVLRGPQGTLFGRNTIGGAVLLTTTPPGDKFGGTARVGLGDDNLREGFLALDMPISDTAQTRVSVGARKRDGYVTRLFDGMDLGNEDTYTAQGTLRWTPSDAFKLTVRGDYSNSEEHGSPFVFAAINESQVFPIFASVAAGCTSPAGPRFPPPVAVPQTLVDPRCANDASWNLGKYKNGGTAPASSSLTNWGTSLVAEWTVSDALTLKSITSYRDLEWVGQRDADNTPLTILHTDYSSEGDQLSEEVQALITAGRFKGVFGLYSFDESVLDFLQVRIAAGAGTPAQTLAGSRDYQRAQIDNENWAAFTQWSFDVTDAFSISAGVRHTEEKKALQMTGFTTYPLNAATIVPTYLRPYTISPTTGLIVQSNVIPTGQTSPGLHVSPEPFSRIFTSTTGSASAQFRWNEAVMTYASISQGFKSGGYNQRFNSVAPGYVPLSFDEESAQTYEIGIKTEFGGVFRLNAAVFNTDYEDMQLIYRVGVVPILFNAGEASIKGGEIEFTYAPGKLIVEGSVGFLDDSFDSVTPIVVPGTAVTATVTPANSLPFTPEMQGNVGIGYDFTLGNSTLTPRVNVSYTDSQFFDAANSVEVAQTEDVTLVNVSLTWANENWKIKAGLVNATDEQYRVAGNSSFGTSAGYAETIYSRPRSWFVSAQFDF